MIAALALVLASSAAITVDAGWGACRSSDAPLPVRIDAQGGTVDLRGELVLVDTRRNVVRLEMDLAHGAHKSWRIPMPSGAGILHADWNGAAGDEVAVQNVGHPVCPGTIVATLERDAGTAVRFPFSAVHGAGGALSPGRLDPADLDAPWQVLDSIDVVMAEARALSELSDGRFAALRTWVLGGGLLVVAPGADPLPLSRSGRMPSTVDLGAPGLMETPWGDGAVIVSPEAAPDPDGRTAAMLVARARVQAAARAGARTQRALLCRTLRASFGPGKARAGAPLLLLGALAGVLGLAHEVLRRRWVVRAYRLSEYAGLLAAGTAALSLASFVTARVAAEGDGGGAVTIFAEGAPVGRRVEPIALFPGNTVAVAHDGVLESEGEVEETLSANAVTARPLGGLSRTGVVWSAVDAGGAVTIARATGGWAIANGTTHDLGPGTLFDGPSAYAVPPIAAGAGVQLAGTLPIPPSLRVDAAFSGEHTRYLVETPDGWWIVRAGTR